MFMECLVISMRILRNMWTGKDNKVGFPVAKSDGGLHYFYSNIKGNAWRSTGHVSLLTWQPSYK